MGNYRNPGAVGIKPGPAMTRGQVLDAVRTNIKQKEPMLNKVVKGVLEEIITEATEKGCQDLSKAKVMETSSSNRCWTAPVLANGKIYIRSNTGILICVDVSFPVTSKP